MRMSSPGKTLRVEAAHLGIAAGEHCAGERDGAGELLCIELAFGGTTAAAFQVIVPAAAENGIEDHAGETMVEP